MNEIQIFNHKIFGDVRILETDEGKLLFCGADVAKALGYQNTRKALSDHCKGVTKCYAPTNGGQQEMSFITEGDVYRLTARSNLPEAVKFESWIFDDLVPAVISKGSYSIQHPDSTSSEVQLLNARTMNANVYLTLLEHIDTKSETYKPVLMAYAANTAAGQPILPLPKSDHGRTYSATEIGAIIGVSRKKIGDLASEFNLRIPQFGQFYHDVAHGREVDSFRYYENAIDEFRRANDTHDRNKADREAEKKRLKAQEKANRKAAK